eukprot:gnl/TRDRNA2_/TRDRNA2_173936_c0_seq2.p2 gnl/TRDRNA2_/TRDRNA2_173936_c0~~gnl/TRDRNA2_/TRDRNA2_173936_c0_seq2.p2  ORF type:complete len:276 (-),score=39.70 gnl/TRDRNA2_/TRDRNA2_173936_c0_seq2:132-959(-)
MAFTFREIISSPEFLKWSCFLFAAWGALTLAFKQMAWFKDKPGGSAHQVVVFVPFTFLAVRGVQLWFFDDQFKGDSRYEKAFGNYPEMISMVLMMFGFQIWDFIITLVTPELRKVEHVVHHFLAGLVAVMVLMNGPHGMFIYYLAFFFGVGEASSVPLAAVDLFRMNKDFAAAFDKVNKVCRVCFAVSFLSVRCVYWPCIIVDLWKTQVTVAIPFKFNLAVLCGSIGLTGLQLYWGSLIVKALIKKMSKGDKSGREVEAREPARAVEAGYIRVEE